jgi:hypothetical protein
MHGKTLQHEADEMAKATGMPMDEETPPEERDPGVGKRLTPPPGHGVAMDQRCLIDVRKCLIDVS